MTGAQPARSDGPRTPIENEFDQRLAVLRALRDAFLNSSGTHAGPSPRPSVEQIAASRAIRLAAITRLKQKLCYTANRRRMRDLGPPERVFDPGNMGVPDDDFRAALRLEAGARALDDVMTQDHARELLYKRSFFPRTAGDAPDSPPRDPARWTKPSIPAAPDLLVTLRRPPCKESKVSAAVLTQMHAEMDAAFLMNVARNRETQEERQRERQQKNSEPPMENRLGCLGLQILSHWTEYRPQMVATLKVEGKLEASVYAAEQLTLEAEAQAVYEGMAPDQATEMYRETWAFLPTEEDQPILSSGTPVRGNARSVPTAPDLPMKSTIAAPSNAGPFEKQARVSAADLAKIDAEMDGAFRTNIAKNREIQQRRREDP